MKPPSSVLLSSLPQSLQELAPGDGGGTGEKLSHCQFMSSSSPREPNGSKGRKAVPPLPLGSRQLTLSKGIPSVGGANFLITSQV